MLIAGRYERARLRQMGARAQGSEVLDVGCAQSMNVHLLSAGRRVTGIDMLAPAGDVRYERQLIGDVFELDRLDDGRSYDTILAGEFIEHVERPYDLLRLLRRHLKPDGRLVLSTPNPLALPVVLFEWTRNVRRFYTEDHVYYFAPRWVARMLTRAGFVVEAVEAVGLWPLALPCPVGMSYQVVYVARSPG